MTVKYTSGGRQHADRALDRGRGRQPARRRGGRPAGADGATSQQKGALKPLDFVKSQIVDATSAPTSSSSARSTASSTASLQGRQQVDRLVQRPAFKDAGVEPPKTWDEFLADAQDDQGLRRRRPTRSAAPTAGRSPTCSRTSTCATAGPRSTTSSPTHEIKWTDPSVKEALTTMATGRSATRTNIAGGTDGALQTDFPTSVANVFSGPRRRRRW